MGDTFPYDAALFATGARPRRWTTIGSTTCDIKNALTLRDQLKAGVRSAVIGTGFIGLQVAACVKMWAAQWSCSKSLLSRSPASTETGAFVAKLHRRHGVDLGLNCSVRGIDNAVSALLANTAPAEAGLSTDDGLVVDNSTDQRSVNFCDWRCGEVLQSALRRSIHFEVWQNAQNQAIIVAKVMAGGAYACCEVPWV